MLKKDDVILQYYKNNCNISKTARFYGIPYSTMRDYIVKWDIKRNRKGKPNKYITE